MRHSASILIALFALPLASLVAAAELPRQTWIATWTASPQPVDLEPDPDEPLLNIEGQTVRERVRVSIGGTQIRVRLSNEHGATPLVIGSATVSQPIDLESVQPGSVRSLTFGGRATVTIPSGAPVLSDPVPMLVASGSEIAVSLYFPEHLATPTLHALALKRAVISARGDFTHAEHIEAHLVSKSSILVSAILVPAQPGRRLVLAFGDSVTDGDASTVDADRTWPSDLARRFAISGQGSKVAVGNAGIAGNRLLSDGFGFSGLARFDRDVLAVPGVTHVILLEGVNDLAFPGAQLQGRYLAEPSQPRAAQDLIGAYRQLIDRAHTRGVKIIGATLLPFEGADLPGFYSESKEAQRQLANAWIRTSGDFDGVIDFDALLRDPDHPSRMAARYASTDHMHPTDVGYQAMADAIDLSLFRNRTNPSPRAHLTHNAQSERDGNRVFELDVYHVVPGKVPALESRFRGATRLFAKHHLEAVGYWVPEGSAEWANTFVYLIAHRSLEDARENWEAFHADPAFQKDLKSEEAEPLIEKVDETYMRATDFSRIQ